MQRTSSRQAAAGTLPQAAARSPLLPPGKCHSSPHTALLRCAASLPRPACRKTPGTGSWPRPCPSHCLRRRQGGRVWRMGGESMCVRDVFPFRPRLPRRRCPLPTSSRNGACHGWPSPLHSTLGNASRCPSSHGTHAGTSMHERTQTQRTHPAMPLLTSMASLAASVPSMFFSRCSRDSGTSAMPATQEGPSSASTLRANSPSPPYSSSSRVRGGSGWSDPGTCRPSRAASSASTYARLARGKGQHVGFGRSTFQPNQAPACETGGGTLAENPRRTCGGRRLPRPGDARA